MATANPPPKTAVTEWCNVFHAQGTENYTSSVIFTKQLTFVALSTITYIKNIFPEDCYTVESFAGLKLKILKSKCSDELAQFLSTSLIQAFDALDKKYLHQLALCFYEDQTKLENLVEYHLFEYSYTPEGVTMNIHSRRRGSEQQSVKCTFEDIKERTTQLIRACLVTAQACQQDLPPVNDVCIRLYYNNDAPEGYQAPGYRCDEPGEDHLEPTRGEASQLGLVQTPYHKIVAKTYIRDLSVQDSREALASPNAPVMTQTQKAMDFNVSVSVQRSVTDSSGLLLKCPCNKYEDIGTYETPLLITCQYCNTLQHAACFGLTVEQVTRLRRHCCTICFDEDHSRPRTDPRLAELSDKKRECLCIFRRTLEWCTKLTSIDGARLMDRLGVSTVNAAKLMKLLHSYGIIRLEPESDLVTPKPINKAKLEAQMGKYFQNDLETSLADQLLAETFASQESNHDPVGDVLSPVEKDTLQNTSTLGRVITNPEPKTDANTNDTTLQQYRDAILSGEQVCEEMPLAGSRDVQEKLKGAKKVGKRKADAPDAKAGNQLRIGVKSKRAKR